MQLFAGEGRTVDAVLADASAGHDNEVARLDGFRGARNFADHFREGAEGSAVDERFADVAFIEAFPADSVGNAALVSAVDHALVNAVAEAARVEQTFGNVLRVGERRAETVAPDVDEKICTLSGPQRVAVDSDDTGHCAAVGVKCGGAVVGFNLVDKVELVIEFDHARVVGEDGDEPVDFLRDLLCALLNEGFVEGDIVIVFAGGLVGVVDFRAEDFVLAVFRPGLREDFEFDVGRFAESVLRAVLCGAEIILNGFHLLKGQRERSGTADFHEFFIGDIEVD